MQYSYVLFKKNRCNDGGFTLLELLVAMFMVSMVTVIIAQALKLSINSWDRAQREGDTFQARVVIPSLLKKQLDATVREKKFANGQAPKKLEFKGMEKGISFFTSFTPMAGNLTGLLRITYLYDTQNKVLFLYQQLILTLDDLKKNRCPLSDNWDGEAEPSGKITGVTRFDLGYREKKSLTPTDLDTLKSKWENKKKPYPGAVVLDFKTNGSGNISGAEPWYFFVGPH